MDNRGWRAGPLRDHGNVVTEGGVVDLVDEDTEESSGLVVGVRLELGVDLDGECGGDGGEQTGLYHELVRVARQIRKAHKYESGVQVFVVLLDEIPVVLFCFTVVNVIECSSGILLG